MKYMASFLGAAHLFTSPFHHFLINTFCCCFPSFYFFFFFLPLFAFFSVLLLLLLIFSLSVNVWLCVLNMSTSFAAFGAHWSVRPYQVGAAAAYCIEMASSVFFVVFLSFIAFLFLFPPHLKKYSSDKGAPTCEKAPLSGPSFSGELLLSFLADQSPLPTEDSGIPVLSCHAKTDAEQLDKGEGNCGIPSQAHTPLGTLSRGSLAHIHTHTNAVWSVGSGEAATATVAFLGACLNFSECCCCCQCVQWKCKLSRSILTQSLDHDDDDDYIPSLSVFSSSSSDLWILWSSLYRETELVQSRLHCWSIHLHPWH